MAAKNVWQKENRSRMQYLASVKGGSQGRTEKLKSGRKPVKIVKNLWGARERGANTKGKKKIWATRLTAYSFRTSAATGEKWKPPGTLRSLGAKDWKVDKPPCRRKRGLSFVHEGRESSGAMSNDAQTSRKRKK